MDSGFLCSRRADYHLLAIARTRKKTHRRRDIVSAQYSQAKQTDPNRIVDPSFVKRIEQSGFIATLYRK
jgi:hypothetical protein